MKKNRILILFAVILMVPSVMLGADAAAVRNVYNMKCSSCHGANGAPTASMAKRFGVKPMNEHSVQSKSDAALKAAILNGYGKMKKVPVSNGDANNLVSYLRTLS